MERLASRTSRGVGEKGFLDWHEILKRKIHPLVRDERGSQGESRRIDEVISEEYPSLSSD